MYLENVEKCFPGTDTSCHEFFKNNAYYEKRENKCWYGYSHSIV